MKKMIKTTGFVSIVALATVLQVSADGEAINDASLRVSGKATLLANFANQKNDSEKRAPYLGIAGSALNFEGQGKTKDIDYSLFVALTADTSDSPGVKEAKIQLRSWWGTFIAGNTNGVERRNKGANSVIGGAGGFTGDFFNAINMTSGVITGTSVEANTGKATKIIYYSPRIDGFQFGISYTPSTTHKGLEGGFDSSKNKKGASLFLHGTKDYSVFDLNSVASSISYNKDFDNGASLTITAVGIAARTKSGEDATTPARDYYHTKAYNIGFVLGYEGWTFGAGYINNLNSRVDKSFEGANAGWSVNGAVSYEIAGYTTSLGYLHSERNLGVTPKTYGTVAEGTDLGKAKADIVSLTLDKKISKNVSIFGELNHFNLRVGDDVKAVQEHADFGLGDKYNPRNRGFGFSTGVNVKF